MRIGTQPNDVTNRNDDEIRGTQTRLIENTFDTSAATLLEKQELPITKLHCSDNETSVVGNEKQIGALTKAYAGFFGEVSNPLTKANNPFFNSKYADLQTVLNTVRPIMKKYGLGIMQVPYISANTYDKKELKLFRNKGTFDIGVSKLVHVQTILTHADGGMIIFPAFSGVIAECNADKEIQAQGALVTYLRRFAINAVLGINGEPDDDGNAVSGNGTTQQVAAPHTQQPKRTKTTTTPTKTVSKKAPRTTVKKESVPADSDKTIGAAVKAVTEKQVAADTASTENTISLADKKVYFVRSMQKLTSAKQRVAVKCIHNVLGENTVPVEQMTEEDLDKVIKECAKNKITINMEEK